MSLSHYSDHIIITKVATPNNQDKIFEWELRKVYTLDNFPDKTALPEFKTDYQVQAKDRIFFFQGCSCPRFKVRPWAEKHGASITIRSHLATVFVAHDKVLQNIVSWEHMVKIPKLSAMNWLDANYDLGDGNLSKLYAAISSCPANYVYLDSQYASHRGIKITGYTYKSTPHADVYSSGYSTPLHGMVSVDCMAGTGFVTEKNWEHLKQLYTNPNVYSQDTIINQVNAEASVIDEDLYEELKTMLSSQDHNNWPMALEIMGSCNLDKSVYNIIKLLREFGQKIYKMKESTHVNFKSLIEYLNLECRYCDITDDYMIDCLIKHNQLTPDIIRPIAEDLKAQWKKKVDGKYFQISKIIVADVVKEALIKHHKNQLAK